MAWHKPSVASSHSDQVNLFRQTARRGTVSLPEKNSNSSDLDLTSDHSETTQGEQSSSTARKLGFDIDTDSESGSETFQGNSESNHKQSAKAKDFTASSYDVQSDSGSDDDDPLFVVQKKDKPSPTKKLFIDSDSDSDEPPLNFNINNKKPQKINLESSSYSVQYDDEIGEENSSSSSLDLSNTFSIKQNSDADRTTTTKQQQSSYDDDGEVNWKQFDIEVPEKDTPQLKKGEQSTSFSHAMGKAELATSLLHLCPEEVTQVLEILTETYGEQFTTLLQKTLSKIHSEKVMETEVDSEKWDWNSQFQTCIQKLAQYQNMEENDQLIAWSSFAKLAGDFNQIAAVYGKIIISEVYTPVNEKTIKPLLIGGSIGGDKYIVKKVLFKFPKAEAGFYDEKAAAKIAGHELKGLVNLFDCNVIDINFPMIALIDYLGFRLIAISCLPLSKDSLIYGSNDAGRTITNRSPQFVELLKVCASKLNIKPHYVGPLDNRVMVYSPADLEGHLGTDQKYYMLDFSRTFPPEPPNKAIKGSHLFRLLRPELVKSNPVPLCSDAFSGFVLDRNEAQEHNKEIIDATDRLFRHIIPMLAQQLNQLSNDCVNRFVLTDNLLIEVIHSHGINLRFLGSLRKYLRNEVFRAAVLVEMLARTLKTLLSAHLRTAMQQTKLPLEHSYRNSVVQLLNKIFGSGLFYWNNTVVAQMKLKYEECLTGPELKDDFCVRKYIVDNVGIMGLLMRFAKMSGLVFTSAALKALTKIGNDIVTIKQPFDAPDIEVLRERVHHMNIVDNAMGLVLKLNAKSNSENCVRLCTTAISSFEKALYYDPRNVFSLRNYADVLATMGYFRQANDYFLLALEADAQDTKTIFQYSMFLLEVGRYKEAYTHFKKLVLLRPSNLYDNFKLFQRRLTSCTQSNLIQTILENINTLFNVNKQKDPAKNDAAQQESDLDSPVTKQRNKGKSFISFRLPSSKKKLNLTDTAVKLSASRTSPVVTHENKQ